MAKKISNVLLTLSSAAILAVYTAGYQRTSPAADRFAAQVAQRHAPLPVVEKAAVLTQLPSISRDINPRTSEPRNEVVAPTPKAAAPAVAEPAPLTVASEPAAPAPPEPAVASPVAEPTVDQTQAPAVTSQPQYRDGVYLGWGYSRHGNIQAFVRIEGGRITHAGIERCETRWSCDLVAHLPGQVIKRQSADVDFVTGATQSGDAFYGAIVNALAQAK